MSSVAEGIFALDPTTILIVLAASICVALLSGGGVFWGVRYLDKLRRIDAQEEATRVVSTAQEEATRVVSTAQDEATRVVAAAQEEARRVVVDARGEASRVSDRARQDADDLRERAQKDVDASLARAKADVDNFRREAELELKEKSMRQKEEFENEKRVTIQEFSDKERRLERRQETLEQQTNELRVQERKVAALQEELQQKVDQQHDINEKLEASLAEQEHKLYEVASLTREDARKMALDRLDQELVEEEGALILKHEKRITEKSQETARKIILTAIQRYAASHTSEVTTSMVDIPNDDMKGRVIGREGRNIRAFEKITGADVVIDDTPGVVIVSAFDMVRREVARLTLSRLISDGRIHPARIEEIYNQAREDVQEFIHREGIEACEEVGIRSLHHKLITYLGRLCFRTSYSQNVLRHSIEVAFLSGMIASEMGLDEMLARRCGLLHDIGKSIDHDVEGGHPKIGAELLRRYYEQEEVIDAALNHHEDPRIAGPYTTIVAAADACSASRPGARRETLENYVRKISEFEKIAKEFPGVENAFAVQAGREIRVMVDPETTTDEGAAKICRDIAHALRDRIQMSGEIKVTVIRETRKTEIVQ